MPGPWFPIPPMISHQQGRACVTPLRVCSVTDFFAVIYGLFYSNQILG